MDRRASKRLSTNLPIMLPTGMAETKNVSAGGAYFELESGDAECYAVGQRIPIWMHANYGYETDYYPQQLWLFDNAIVVRKDAIVVRKEEVEEKMTPHRRWGFGLKFSNEMGSMLSTPGGFY